MIINFGTKEIHLIEEFLLSDEPSENEKNVDNISNDTIKNSINDYMLYWQTVQKRSGKYSFEFFGSLLKNKNLKLSYDTKQNYNQFIYLIITDDYYNQFFQVYEIKPDKI